jgi:two-component system CheB/CheR fusion protein
VILLDIGLPRMDGYEVARMLRGAVGYPGLLAAVTGWGSADDRERSSAAGFDVHLVKPVSVGTFRDLLSRPHRRSEREQEVAGAVRGT